MDASTKEGIKRIEDYNRRINSNTEKIRANVSAHEKQRMNIGNYKSALEGLPGPLGKAASGVSRLSSTMGAFIAMPIVAAIAAIAGALKLLWEGFKASDEGADLLEQTTSGLRAGWEQLTKSIGAVINGHRSLGEAMKNLRKDMQDATLAAGVYRASMQNLEDLTVLHTSTEADMRKEISELSRTYKDVNLPISERIAAYEKLLGKEEELMAFKRDIVS